MFSDQPYAQLCQRTYDVPPDWQGLGQNANIHAVRAEINGRLAICFRGSKEPRDWLLDLLAIPALDLKCWTHWKLGLVHTGFMVGAQAIVAQIIEAVDGKPYALCGHSLGGALALLTAGLLVAEGRPAPEEVVTFGAPRPAMLMLRHALRGVPIRQYRFGADIVPLVPTHPYVHVREPLVQIGEAIRDLNDGLFANHHIENYISALEPKP